MRFLPVVVHVHRRRQTRDGDSQRNRRTLHPLKRDPRPTVCPGLPLPRSCRVTIWRPVGSLETSCVLESVRRLNLVDENAREHRGELWTSLFERCTQADARRGFL